MENNELSNIWKSQANREIKPYSISELDNMIVKNARNAIPHLFPGLKTKAVLSALVTVYLLWEVIAGSISLSLKIFYGILIVIVLISWILLWKSLRKMQMQNPAIPVKEWIKEKIIYIDKSIAYQKKYDTSISIGLTLFIVGIFIIQNYILHGTIILFTLIVVLITVSIALYLSYVRKKRFKEVRNYLQSLYEQLDESR